MTCCLGQVDFLNHQKWGECALKLHCLIAFEQLKMENNMLKASRNVFGDFKKGLNTNQYSDFFMKNEKNALDYERVFALKKDLIFEKTKIKISLPLNLINLNLVGYSWGLLRN